MKKIKIYIIMCLSAFCLCVIGNNIPMEYNNKTIDLLVGKILLERRNIANKYEFSDTKNTINLVNLLKAEKKGLDFYIKDVSKEKNGIEKISICIEAYRIALGSTEFSNYTTIILKSNLDYRGNFKSI